MKVSDWLVLTVAANSCRKSLLNVLWFYNCSPFPRVSITWLGSKKLRFSKKKKVAACGKQKVAVCVLPNCLSDEMRSSRILIDASAVVHSDEKDFSLI